MSELVYVMCFKLSRFTFSMNSRHHCKSARMEDMRLDPKLLLASMGISAGLVLFIAGFNVGLTGREATNLPDAIEAISPGEGERVLRQSQVIVDFIEGYEATLFID